jgi:D-galactarolactone cycloisomerase
MAALPPAPHSWKPAPMWMEYEQTENPFRDLLVTERVVQRDGKVAIPQKPGLGFTVNPEIVKKYRVV